MLGFIFCASVKTHSQAFTVQRCNPASLWHTLLVATFLFPKLTSFSLKLWTEHFPQSHHHFNATAQLLLRFFLIQQKKLHHLKSSVDNRKADLCRCMSAQCSEEKKSVISASSSFLKVFNLPKVEGYISLTPVLLSCSSS